MRKFKQIITMVFVLLVFPFCFHVKAAGEFIDWDKTALRENVQCYADRVLSKNAVHTLRGENLAYANVCSARIGALKKFLKNAIFLPVEVDSYVKGMNVGVNSYEAGELMKIASMSKTEEFWKKSIRELIKAYEDLRNEYEFCLDLLF